MPFFSDKEEVYKYLGGVFEKAKATESGPNMAKADLDLQVYYSEPESKLLVNMRGDNIEVHTDTEDANADVKLFMPADIGDRFWRGEYNLAVGLARGQVKAKGPINKILKLVPLTKPLFPIYREMIAEKEAAPV